MRYIDINFYMVIRLKLKPSFSPAFPLTVCRHICCVPWSYTYYKWHIRMNVKRTLSKHAKQGTTIYNTYVRIYYYYIYTYTYVSTDPYVGHSLLYIITFANENVLRQTPPILRINHPFTFPGVK